MHKRRLKHLCRLWITIDETIKEIGDRRLCNYLLDEYRQILPGLALLYGAVVPSVGQTLVNVKLELLERVEYQCIVAVHACTCTVKRYCHSNYACLFLLSKQMHQ